MKTKRIFPLLIFILSFVVTACAPQVAVTSTATAALPSATVAPTVAATVTPAKFFEGLSSGLNIKAQARIRTTNLVMSTLPTDVYVNGMLASNGGVTQENIAPGRFSGFLYVTPGTYSIALVPHGETLDKALFPPTDVKMEAGHRYTVAAMGQLEDKDIHPLVADETALEAGLGASNADNRTIEFNNMKGADSLTELANDQIRLADLKYGEVSAWYCPSGPIHFATQATSSGTKKTFWEDDGGAEPGVSFALPWFGPYPASNYDLVANISQGTSELNVIDYLAGFEGRNVKIDRHLATFNTFLKIVEKAGLRDQLINTGPYFLLVPTDEAFSKLSPADLDALLNDPQALMNLLKAHIVDGYFPRGSLSTSSMDKLSEISNRTIINRLGKELVFDGDSVNHNPIGPNYTVGNGNRVQIIYTLLPYK